MPTLTEDRQAQVGDLVRVREDLSYNCAGRVCPVIRVDGDQPVIRSTDGSGLTDLSPSFYTVLGPDALPVGTTFRLRESTEGFYYADRCIGERGRVHASFRGNIGAGTYNTVFEIPGISQSVRPQDMHDILTPEEQQAPAGYDPNIENPVPYPETAVEPGPGVRVHITWDGGGYQGLFGTIIEAHPDYGSLWRIRLDNGAGTGRHNVPYPCLQLAEGAGSFEVVNPQPERDERGFKVGDRVRVTWRPVTEDWRPLVHNQLGVITDLSARHDYRVLLDNGFNAGAPTPYLILGHESIERVDGDGESPAPAAWDPAQLQVGDRAVITDQQRQGSSLTVGEQVTVVGPPHLGDPSYVCCEGPGVPYSGFGVMLDNLGPEPTPDSAPAWDPTQLREGDQATLVDRRDQTHLLRDLAVGTVLTVVRNDENHASFRHEAVYASLSTFGVWHYNLGPVEPQAPAPAAPAQPAEPEANVGDITVEVQFTLHNACTAEPTSIRHYMRSHIQELQWRHRSNPDHPILKVDGDHVEVINSERTAVGWSCPNCGSDQVRAEIQEQVEARAYFDLDPEDGCFRLAYEETDDPDFNTIYSDTHYHCHGCGHNVSTDDLEEAGIDTELEF